ncbi:MAG: cytochrome c oxidase subunit II [Acidimicrobiales bacterium]
MAVVALAAAGCGSSRFGLPRPASSQAGHILALWRVLFLTAVAIGGLVIALILWSVVRYRRPPDGGPPVQTRGNVPLEAFYTAVPLAIVVALFALTVRTQHQVTRLSVRPDLRVDVTGFQWGWRFHYPDAGVTVTGDANRNPVLVLPEGRTVELALSTADVIHSFFVPSFLEKRDMVPGVDNRIDVETTRLGRFPGLCAEFCGLDHARMGFTVEVVSPQDFQAWLSTAASQQTDQPGAPGASAPGEGGSAGRQASVAVG